MQSLNQQYQATKATTHSDWANSMATRMKSTSHCCCCASVLTSCVLHSLVVFHDVFVRGFLLVNAHGDILRILLRYH